MYEIMKKIQKPLWKDDDKMGQDTLFELQDLFADVILEVATKEHKGDDLVETFPWLYRKKER